MSDWGTEVGFDLTVCAPRPHSQQGDFVVEMDALFTMTRPWLTRPASRAYCHAAATSAALFSIDCPLPEEDITGLTAGVAHVIRSRLHFCQAGGEVVT